MHNHFNVDEQIQELKTGLDEQIFDETEDSVGESDEGYEQSLFWPERPLRLEQIILELLPPRPVVERYLASYFNAGYSVPRKPLASFQLQIMTIK